jgi:hypothetical protein
MQIYAECSRSRNTPGATSPLIGPKPESRKIGPIAYTDQRVYTSKYCKFLFILLMKSRETKRV